MDEMHRARYKGREMHRTSILSLGKLSFQNLKVFVNVEALHTPSFRIFMEVSLQKHN